MGTSRGRTQAPSQGASQPRQGLSSGSRAAATFSSSNQMLRSSPAASSFPQAAEQGASSQRAHRIMSARRIAFS